MTFETFLFVVTLLYIIQVSIFILGLRRNNDTKNNSNQLFVSVIIAARNEESNISACIESVANQTYPTDQYEIIIANDGSVDRTEAIVKLIFKIF